MAAVVTPAINCSCVNADWAASTPPGSYPDGSWGYGPGVDPAPPEPDGPLWLGIVSLPYIATYGSAVGPGMIRLRESGVAPSLNVAWGADYSTMVNQPDVGWKIEIVSPQGTIGMDVAGRDPGPEYWGLRYGDWANDAPLEGDVVYLKLLSPPTFDVLAGGQTQPLAWDYWVKGGAVGDPGTVQIDGTANTITLSKTGANGEDLSGLLTDLPQPANTKLLVQTSANWAYVLPPATITETADSFIFSGADVWTGVVGSGSPTGAVIPDGPVTVYYAFD
jgi:hypothetical protein